MNAALDRVVVVGASAAGLAAAETLRREGFGGRLRLIGDEPRLPYDRPPLSKQVLAGGWEPERTLLRDAPALRDLGIEARLGVPATGLDAEARMVALADGSSVPYDGLIIATGVRPRRLAAGHDIPGVHVLRTLDQTLALRRDLRYATRVVVVGAGFLGCEIAASARLRDLEVTLIDPMPAPMVRPFGELVGGLVAELHRSHGTRLIMGTGVSRVLGEGELRGVELTDGTVLSADVVVVAIGAAPATDWLAGSGIVLDDGVVCDSMCRAAPGVYAAGDVARWHHAGFGTTMRIEHRMNATEQGIAAARNLLGAQARFTPVPFFWTDQYDARIQAYGHFPAGCQAVLADGGPPTAGGGPAARRFTAHYVADGTITGVLGWNMPRHLRAQRDLIGTAR